MIEGCKRFWNCRGGWIYLCGFIWLLELRQYIWQRKWDSGFCCSWSSSQLSVNRKSDRVTVQKRAALHWHSFGVMKSTSLQICAGLCLWQGPSIEMYITVATWKHPLPGCCSSGAKCCNRDQLSEPFWKGICRAIRGALLCLVIDLGKV